MCVENRNRNPILSSVQNHLESVAALCYPSTLTLDSIWASCVDLPQLDSATARGY
jgi:hypothetical protein